MEMAILCAWCGELILPDSPITLYSPIDQLKTPLKPGSKAFVVENGTANYVPFTGFIPEGHHLVYVGCLRWNCSISGADRAGFWIPPGMILRTPSPLELALNSNEPVIIEDLGDIRKALNL